MVTRFQLGRSDTEERSRLVEHRPELKDELIHSIVKASGHGSMTWQADGEPRVDASNVEDGVTGMLKFAGDASETVRIRSIPEQGSVQASVHLWVLVGNAPDISTQIPDEARKANGGAIDAMLAFHGELALVFPEYKTLGGYVPRPIKDQIPPGWVVGDPWPMFEGKLAFASEHAWGDAVDAGKSDGAGGFDQGPSLRPLLVRITDYTLANRARIKLVDHIFDRHSFHVRNGFQETDFTGSDPHDTHTHSAFGEHDGEKPPWL